MRKFIRSESHMIKLSPFPQISIQNKEKKGKRNASWGERAKENVCVSVFLIRNFMFPYLSTYEQVLCF